MLSQHEQPAIKCILDSPRIKVASSEIRAAEWRILWEYHMWCDGHLHTHWLVFPSNRDCWAFCWVNKQTEVDALWEIWIVNLPTRHIWNIPPAETDYFSISSFGWITWSIYLGLINNWLDSNEYFIFVFSFHLRIWILFSLKHSEYISFVCFRARPCHSPCRRCDACGLRPVFVIQCAWSRSGTASGCIWLRQRKRRTPYFQKTKTN